MKRALCAILIVQLLAVWAFPAFADGVKPGETISVRFFVTANPNKAVAATVKLDYDHSALEMVDSTGFVNDKCGLMDISGISVSSPMSATFLVKAGAADGIYPITASVLEAMNIDEEYVGGMTVSGNTVSVNTECAHPTTTPIVHLDRYISKYGTYHMHDYYYDVVCDVCGKTVSSPMGNIEEEHTFDSDGVCVYCNYTEERPCLHTNTRMDLESQNIKSINDSSHQVSTTYKIVCNACGITVDRKTETVTRSHSLDANGDCEECEYRAGCRHTQTKRVLIDTDCRVIDENRHENIEVYNEVCANEACGKVIKPNITQSSKEAHHFSGNTCTVCGYVRAEALSVSVSANQSGAKVGDYISASAVGKGGSGAYYFGWAATCNGAEEAVGPFGTDDNWGTTATKEGKWVFTVTLKDRNTGETRTASTGGIAVVKTCGHTRTRDDLRERNVERISDDQHAIHLVYDVYCADCGVWLRTRTETSAVGHTYDEAGICECGQNQQVCPVHGNAHRFDYRNYEKDHPHYRYVYCDCGASQYIGAYETANGAVQPENECCICHGHQFGEDYAENGAWYCAPVWRG